LHKIAQKMLDACVGDKIFAGFNAFAIVSDKYFGLVRNPIFFKNRISLNLFF